VNQNKESASKSITFEVNVWRGDDGAIRISSKTEGFITTVNNNPGSERCHKHLYGHLKKLLIKYEKWDESK